MNTRTIVGIMCLFLGLFFLYPDALLANEKAVYVGKIEVTGTKVLSPKTFSSILKEYEEKELTLGQMEKLTALISDVYKKKGYIIAKAYIPEQKFSDGILKVAVLEGRIGEVKITGEHKYYPDDFIRMHFNPVTEKEVLNQDALERAVLLLNDYPKLHVTTWLQPGQEPGTTDIIVKADNSMPINLTVDYNNFGSKFVSRDRYGATVDFGNFLRNGALFSVRGVSGDDPSDLFYWRASYALPINAVGTKFNMYYAKGDFDVVREFGDLGMKGESESFGASVTHPFIKKTFLGLTGEIGMDFKDTEQFLLHTRTSNDQIRTAKAGLIYESTDTTGRNYGTFYVTQGLGNSLGGMKNNADDASRLGADNRFTRLNLDFMRLQKLAAPLYVIVKVSGQWSSDPLTVSEAFIIGGADSVRGFPSGEYVGDSGYTASAEFRYSPLSNRNIFQIAGFIDTGYVDLKRPQAGENDHKSITGGGGGVRFNLPYDFNIRADIGWPLDPSSSSDKGTGPIVCLQATKKF